MTDQEIIYTIALTQLEHIGSMHQYLLMDTFGSGTEIFENRKKIRQTLPDVSVQVENSLAHMEEKLARAEAEYAFAQEKHIRCLSILDEDYPLRLRECPDAPIMLYYRGNADLNAQRIVSIVGTRKITEYGKELCRSLLRDLGQLCPEALIVSGLAYGVDIHAHRAALDSQMGTVGVLAHGLDQIYPRLHRETAVQMLQHGGLLTEYLSGTAIDRMNFVARNRIVAGVADVTVIVESALKGGSLITAQIARDYNRDVLAFPGRVNDRCSAGCNKLIARNEAGLIQSAQDLMDAMCWPSATDKKNLQQKNAQLSLFPDLSEEEQRIVAALEKSDGKGANQLSIEANIPIGQLASHLLALEMKGVVKMMAGGMYRLNGL